MLTRSMLLERREKLATALSELQGALQCIDELLEADAVPTAGEALETILTDADPSGAQPFHDTGL